MVCCCPNECSLNGLTAFLSRFRSFCPLTPLRTLRIKICCWSLWWRPVFSFAWAQGVGGSQVQGLPKLKMSSRLVWIAQRDLSLTEEWKIWPQCSSIDKLSACPACIKPWVESSASHTWLCTCLYTSIGEGEARNQHSKSYLATKWVWKTAWDKETLYPHLPPPKKGKVGLEFGLSSRERACPLSPRLALPSIHCVLYILHSLSLTSSLPGGRLPHSPPTSHTARFYLLNEPPRTSDVIPSCSPLVQVCPQDIYCLLHFQIIPMCTRVCFKDVGRESSVQGRELQDMGEYWSVLGNSQGMGVVRPFGVPLTLSQVALMWLIVSCLILSCSQEVKPPNNPCRRSHCLQLKNSRNKVSTSPQNVGASFYGVCICCEHKWFTMWFSPPVPKCDFSVPFKD